MVQIPGLDSESAPRRHQHITRPRLLRKLEESLRCKLTLVCASAGAGKTTLLRDFAAQTHANVVWYPLDRTDRDPSVFAKRLLSALEGTGVPGTVGDASLLQTWEPVSLLPLLIRVLSESARLAGSRLILLLDDYHKVAASKSINHLLAGIVQQLPPGVHLVLSSRVAPAFPMARLRLDGELLELTQEDLAFNASEASDLLAHSLGMDLSREDTQLILDKTRGWVAGLSMLTQYLGSRGKEQLMTVLRAFGGSSRVVYDYFAEEVLQQQSPSARRFLLATSLLSELHRDLVNHLLGTSSAQEVLESLEASSVFITSLDETHDWYKYHPLFRGFLRAKAERTLGGTSLGELHRRAAAAYLSQSNCGQAIDHLCAAGDFEDAALIVEQVGYDQIDNGNLETVKHWLDTLPRIVRQCRPWLLEIEGRIAQRQGNYGQATAALLQAQLLFAEQGDGEGLARVAVDSALVSNRVGHHREAVHLLESVLNPILKGQTRADVLRTQCISYRQLGRLEQAARIGEAALAALGSSQGLESKSATMSQTLRALARTHLVRGDLDYSLALSLRARDLCTRETIGRLELSYVMCLLGAIRAVRGESDLALEAFAEAEAGTARFVEPQQRRVNLGCGNIYTDFGEFAEAEECYEKALLPAPERGWLCLRQGEAGRAADIAMQGLEQLGDSEQPLARARLLGVLGMARAATGPRGEAWRPLEDAISLLASHGYRQYLASLRLHMAQMQLRNGQISEGTTLLEATVADAEGHGFYHFYWWDPEMMAELLGAMVAEGRHQRYIDRLVRLHQGDADRHALSALAEAGRTHLGDASDKAGADSRVVMQRAAAIVSECPDPKIRSHLERAVMAEQLPPGSVVRLRDDFGLTWREVDVFLTYYLERRLADGESSDRLRKRLAEEMCISESTLKSHVRSIRQKLSLPVTADSLQVYHAVLDHGERHHAHIAS